MKIEQIYTGCLAQGAYYIESNGEAAIIDPLRETDPYLEKAKTENSNIKYIFETHFHADFVSGHVDLAQKTGATIVFGPNAETQYEIHQAKDDEVFQLGAVTIKALHTPGHTMESTCYLLCDENGKETALFSGDTLFIGDVGRPDLAAKSELSQEDLAGHLFDSLRTKVMPLPNDVIVYPAHGAGSACGKNMSKETYDSLGNQKNTNYALRADMTREEFIKEVTDGIMPPPQYFPKNVLMNKMGYDSLDLIMEKGMVALDPTAFEARANAENALVLDTRHQQKWAAGHIPRSIFIGIDGGFAPWVGTLIVDLKQPILIVADPGREQEVITRLARVGYDNCLGYLKGGFEAWAAEGRETDSVETIPATEFKARLTEGHPEILDVRKPGEFTGEHIKDAISFPLDYINDNFDQLDPERPYFIHCLGGYRSMITASILKARGFHKLTDIQKGIRAIKEAGIPVTDFVCPSTV